MHYSSLFSTVTLLGILHLDAVASLSCYRCTYMDDVITANDLDGLLRETIMTNIEKINDEKCKLTGNEYTASGYKSQKCPTVDGQTAVCLSGIMRITRAFPGFDKATLSLRNRLRTCAMVPSTMNPSEGCRDYNSGNKLDMDILNYLNRTKRYRLSDNFVAEGKYCLCRTNDCNSGLESMQFSTGSRLSPSDIAFMAVITLVLLLQRCF